MRRLVLLGLALLLASCNSREQQALSFLQETFPGIEFEVEEAGPVIPLYYPGFELMGISSLANGQEDEFNAACLHFEEVMKDPAAYARAHPDECDTKGFRAWVHYPAGVLDATFFYGDKGIMASTLELQQQYNDLLKTAFDL